MHGGDAHLAHHLHHALHRGLNVAVLTFAGVGQDAPFFQIADGFESQVGANGRDTVADERAEVVHLSWLRRFQHQAHTRAKLPADQLMMQAGAGQQRRNGREPGIRAPVC
ncbi:hypothetical protein SDC9_141018 [bioreactor metagenome]|uniref:Uncharacterized protein n=1 Tax=bioreactor metagenome TaxID=1076179 RepID=A0A645DX03_9ZZZZ